MNAKASRATRNGDEALRLRFLVAEDHEFQRKTLVRALQGSGSCNILEAADGHEALACFHNAPQAIDIIICDLDMPNMDGMEFIAYRRNGPRRP